jgi:hypothetical protein
MSKPLGTASTIDLEFLMKDFFGQELAVGDHVLISTSGSRGFEVHTIVKFSPKMVQVDKSTKWHPGRMMSVHPTCTVKISAEMMTWYTLTRK